MKVISCFLFFILNLHMFNCSAVIQQNGGYSNVVVMIASNLPYQKDTSLRILDNIKNLLLESSEILYVATRNHTFLENITIVLPSSWASNQKIVSEFQATKPNVEYDIKKADVVVDNPNPLYGDHPYTRQSSICGMPGHYIHYTPKHLEDVDPLNVEDESAKTFVHHWSKLRYGVYEEFGFSNDPVYSQYYYDDDGEVQLTSCTDSELEGQFWNEENQASCQVKNISMIELDNCYFNVTNNELKSSLMYSSKHGIDTFCDSANLTHNSYAPTKHNFLCDFKATWDVISNSSDFYKISDTIKSKTEINFIFNKDKVKQATVLFDVSNKDQRKVLFLALRLFSKVHLNKGTHVKCIALDDKHTPYPQDSDVNWLDLVDLPDKRNITSGVDKAIYGGVDSLIIIINGGIKDKEMKKIRENAMEKNVDLSFVFYSNNTISQISEATLKRKDVYEIHDIEKLNVIKGIKEALVTILEDYIHQDTITLLDSNVKHTKRNFTMVENPENYLTVFVDGDTKLDFNTNCPKTMNKRHSGATSIWNEKYKYIEGKGNKSKNCYYEVSTENNGTVLIDISGVKQEHKSKHKITLWTDFDPQSGLFIINAQVLTNDSYPIIDAQVVAKVRSIKNPTEREVRLFDIGNGDPDLMKNDGIYSAYFLYPVVETKYEMFVDVRGTQLTYKNEYTSHDNKTRKVCCGSFVPSDSIQKLDPFTQVSSTVFVKIENLVGVAETRPSRIGDLKCNYVGHEFSGSAVQYTLNLTWTAPTSRSLNENVTSYYISLSNRRSEFFDENMNLMELTDKDDNIFLPSPPFTIEEHTIQVNKSGAIFIGIYSADETGRQSKVSNIAQVFVVKKAKIPDKTKKDKQAEKSAKKSASVGYIIMGTCLGLLVIVVLIGIYISRKKKNKKREENKESDENEGKSYDNTALDDIKAGTSSTRRKSQTDV